MAGYEADVNLLLVSDDPFPVRSFRVTSEAPFLLGRASGSIKKYQSGPNASNAFFDSVVISRNHAELTLCPLTGALRIRDVGSMHGTEVNFQKLRQAENRTLVPGDRIELGSSVFDNGTTHITRQFSITFVTRKALPSLKKADLVDLSSPTPMPSKLTKNPTISRTNTFIAPVVLDSDSESANSDSDNESVRIISNPIRSTPFKPDLGGIPRAEIDSSPSSQALSKAEEPPSSSASNLGHNGLKSPAQRGEVPTIDEPFRPSQLPTSNHPCSGADRDTYQEKEITTSKHGYRFPSPDDESGVESEDDNMDIAIVDRSSCYDYEEGSESDSEDARDCPEELSEEVSGNPTVHDDHLPTLQEETNQTDSAGYIASKSPNSPQVSIVEDHANNHHKVPKFPINPQVEIANEVVLLCETGAEATRTAPRDEIDHISYLDHHCPVSPSFHRRVSQPNSIDLNGKQQGDSLRSYPTIASGTNDVYHQSGPAYGALYPRAYFPQPYQYGRISGNYQTPYGNGATDSGWPLMTPYHSYPGAYGRAAATEYSFKANETFKANEPVFRSGWSSPPRILKDAGEPSMKNKPSEKSSQPPSLPKFSIQNIVDPEPTDVHAPRPSTSSRDVPDLEERTTTNKKRMMWDDEVGDSVDPSATSFPAVQSPSSLSGPMKLPQTQRVPPWKSRSAFSTSRPLHQQLLDQTCNTPVMNTAGEAQISVKEPPQKKVRPLTSVPASARVSAPALATTEPSGFSLSPELWNPSGNPDYQMQLMLLEQQNKKRLRQARMEQRAANLDPQSPEKGVHPNELISGLREKPTTIETNDVLDSFDFDTFINVPWGSDVEGTKSITSAQPYPPRSSSLTQLASKTESRATFPKASYIPITPIVGPPDSVLPAKPRVRFSSHAEPIATSDARTASTCTNNEKIDYGISSPAFGKGAPVHASGQGRSSIIATARARSLLNPASSSLVIPAADRNRNRNQNSAYGDSAGTSIGKTLKPFVLGALIGGIGVFGALIGLPENYF